MPAGCPLHCGIMNTARCVLFGLSLAVAMAASAQYQWIDRDGRRVFSDTPPPVDLPEKNLLSRPRAAASAPQRAAVAPAKAASATPAAAPQPPPKTGDAAKLKAEQEQAAAIRADNCRRATAAKAGLDSGMRLVRVNEQGEREFIDDAQRDAEQQRLRQIIASECQ